MAKENKIVGLDVLTSDCPVLVGELRGVKLDCIKWVDKSSGKAQEMQLCKASLELGVYPHVSQCEASIGARGQEADAYASLSVLPRGSRIAIAVTAYRVERGIRHASAVEWSTI